MTPATAEGNPLSPDSQAFMDMLEHHLSEHDNASVPGNRPPPVSDAAAFPSFASVAGNVSYENTKLPPPPSLVQPQQQQQQPAPSPQTMAALINILQIQAQAQGMDPQEQQRHLANVLSSFPTSVPYNRDPQTASTGNAVPPTLNRQGQALQSYNTSTLQQQQQQQLSYPYPGVDTPEHSGPGSTSASGDTGKRDFSAGVGSTDSNGNTPPRSSPEAILHSNPIAAAGTGRVDKEAVEKQRRAMENALEAQARSQLDMLDRRWEAGPSKGNTFASVPPPAVVGSTGAMGSRKPGSGSSADGPLVKRKAGDEEIEGHQSHRNRPAGEGGDSNEDDSEADDHDSPPKKSTRKGAGGASSSSRRKSTATGEAAGGKGDEGLDEKALKRKNQNRAAQKAFRERREARVKDLEDKVGELEAKNAGHEFENENLRQLLAKLQQENMALKNTAFTFSMPMPNNIPAPAAAAAKSQSPPTLPNQSYATAEALRNLVERFSPTQQQLPPSHPLQHRGDSTSSSASGISNTVRSAGSAGASGPGSAATTRSPTELSPLGSASASPLGAPGNNVFNPEPFNAFASTSALGQGPANASHSLQQQTQPSRNTVSPDDQSQGSGTQGNPFAQFAAAVADSNMSSIQNNAVHQHRPSASSAVNLDQNTSSMTDATNASASGGAGGGNEMDWQNLLNNNFTMLAQAPEFMSFTDDAAFGNFAGFSDIWPGFSGQDFSAFAAAEEQDATGGSSSGDMNMAGIQSTLLDGDHTGSASNLNQFNTLQTKSASSGADDALMNMADDNMEEFLRSLGAGGSGTADDVFDMNFIDPSSDETAAATVDSSGNLGSDLYKQFVGYKSSPAASNAGASSSLSSAPSSILSPSNYFTTSPDPSSASSISANNNQSGMLSNNQGSSSDYAQKQGSTSGNNESAFRVGTFGGGAVSDHKPAMLRKDGTVVTCDKMWEVVATKIPFLHILLPTIEGAAFKEEEADIILAEYAAERQLKQQMAHQQQQQAAAMPNRSQPAATNNAMFFQ
ncbi:hypothetical protein QFC22_004772 [Naganishia vaughanmartiniae]|uniref:Uncharacterized protein n=1 Tax=Naganishia vaughanmartiniae TaxID=1424756 RepID=A0ACC2WXF0_9TREE|nr:hypothetical protein QFC22_004772 [Naganishia vaughanmartiniae]